MPLSVIVLVVIIEPVEKVLLFKVVTVEVTDDDKVGEASLCVVVKV